MQFDEILPEVVVGTCPLTMEDVDGLSRDYGITAVLNLQSDQDLAYWGIDWPQLLTQYQTRGVTVRRVPVIDFAPDDLTDKLPACVAALDDLLRLGHKVYVHCNAGINRSPSTVVAYLHWVRKWTLEAALAHVCRRRDCDPYVEAIRDATGMT